MKHFDIFIDGASKGNPGPSGIGAIICHQGQVIRNLSQYIGRTTNNVAEYTALIYALQEAIALKAETVAINTDSQLLARQFLGEYKVKDEKIKLLFNQARRLINGFKGISVNNIPREKNRGADKLATQAIKKESKRSLIKRAECGCSRRFASQSEAAGEESPGSRG